MLQHQIVQSPARLGLTNPTSPSLQNPTPTPPKPPPHHSHHSSSSSTSTTINAPTITSSTLLPLLPPLPRAQTLLIQMASLASKLFHVSPNRSLWLSSFRGSLPNFLPSSQSQAQIPFDPSIVSSTKDILSHFNVLQTQLYESVAQLQEILDYQDSQQKLVREIKAKDSSLLSFANKLKDVERVLDILVDDYSDYRRPKRSKLAKDEVAEDVDDEDSLLDSSNSTVATQLGLRDILSYAHRISYTTFAPPEFGAGQAPLRGALPPAPQDEQMRASQLYNFANLDVGLPSTVESKEKTVEAIIEPPPPIMLTEGNQHALAAIQGVLPPNITVPSGWKPGMPVELPTDLPVPPPGWKPGDPVALPPLEEQQVRPHAIPGLHKPSEVIQVRPVQLDILDQDDDSSDYSSDDGSSEDED